MKFIADLHVHSYLSRGTSRDANLEGLYKWAQLKGITLVATGDFTHPEWFAQLQEKLEPAEAGLFKLKGSFSEILDGRIPSSCRNDVRFILNVEISSIYRKKGRVRKNHNLVFAPDFSAAEKINSRLARVGNIRSDGRPILGLDARDLLEIVLEASNDAFLVPAHIWTPWFSLFGSKSGFDAVEECFEDLSKYIFALETGLSSDPAMNWTVSKLDGFTLISNSDAHSLRNLGREANLFETELSYFGLRKAMETGDSRTFPGTIEYFPEQGKYHYDGHRKCRIRYAPSETVKHDGLCTCCGKPVTVGVSNRVRILSDREEGFVLKAAHPYTRLLTLTDILAEIHRMGPKCKKVQESYSSLLSTLGPELKILLESSLEEIESAGLPLLAEAVRRMRAGKVDIRPGFDGEFGTVRLFTDEEINRKESLSIPERHR